MQAILFPQINPIIFNIGELSIRWYSIAYIVGIMLGYIIIKKINKGQHQVFPKESFDDLILFSVLGIIFGGRFGYVFLYDFEGIKNNFFSIFYIWKGGMSFHGGLIGLILAIYFHSKRYKINFLNALDLISLVAPIGIFFGRIANFINAELYGRAADVPWAVIFPNAGNFGRHPSQIYEALLEGVLIFIIMIFSYKKVDIKKSPGRIGSIFMISYSIARMFAEHFREPDIQIGFIFNSITMGQILSVPMLFVGLYFFYRNKC